MYKVFYSVKRFKAFSVIVCISERERKLKEMQKEWKKITFQYFQLIN